MEEEALSAWYYDGITAQRHHVQVALCDGSLLFLDRGELVPLADLRPVGDRHHAAFAHRARRGWRLSFEGPLPSGWAVALPRQERHGGIIDRIGIVPSLLGGSMLAAALLYLLVQGTSLVAQLIPKRWEAALGQSISGDLGGRLCNNPEGRHALDRLTSKLVSDRRPITVQVVNLPLVNAAAMPGRQVVIFRGMIDQATSPDEIAGVLGHEIGHVEHRHVMAALLRDYGLSLLLGGVDGGTLAQNLLSSRYSRNAEKEADDSALRALNQAGVSPLATAGLFGRIAASERLFPRATRLFGYLASHPLSTERSRHFAAGAQRGVPYRSALDPKQWKALRAICKG